LDGSCWEMELKATGIVCPFVVGTREISRRDPADVSEGCSATAVDVMTCVSARCKLGPGVGRGGATATLAAVSTFELRKNGNLMVAIPCCISQTTSAKLFSTRYATPEDVPRKQQSCSSER
jgi:hypothetical protein